MSNLWDRLIIRFWRKRQQAVDLDTLWPALCQQTGDLDTARRAFRKHMEDDPAYGYMTEVERNEYAARLSAPPP